jgi:hypothetical protein
MIAQVGYSVAGQSRGRVALCAVCTGHVETRSASFLVEPQNQGGGGFPSLHHHGGCVGGKLKLDGSMRRAASDPATLALPFFFYYAIRM